MENKLLSLNFAAVIVTTDMVMQNFGLKILIGIISFVLVWLANNYFNNLNRKINAQDVKCESHTAILQGLLDKSLSRQEIIQIFNEAITLSLANGLGGYINNVVKQHEEKHHG